MNIDKLTVTVNAELCVPKGTAECCLKLVEMYVNQTGCFIEATRTETGEVNYRFVERKEHHEKDQG